MESFSIFRWGQQFAPVFAIPLSLRLTVVYLAVEYEDLFCDIETGQLRSFNSGIERAICTEQIRCATIFQLMCQFPCHESRIGSSEDSTGAKDAHENNGYEQIVTTEKKNAISFPEML